MKRLFLIMFLSLFLVAGAFAQVTYDDMEKSFTQFSDDVSTALPFASTIGLQWSDAAVRGFPHFGVGLSVGAVTIPESAFTSLAYTLNLTLPSELTSLGIGVPLPSYTVDARLGLPFLPLDVGVKLGVIPPDTLNGTGYSVDYTLAGFDIRTPIIKQNIILPAVSLGVGFNYLSSTMSMTAAGLGNSIDLSGYGLGNITFTDPDIAFTMESKTIDAKLQVSKSLFIITPYIGVGYSYGWSNAGGGMLADIEYNGSTITQADIDAINAALAAADQTPLDLSKTQVLISKDNTGGAFRAFGGVSLNIFILKLDISGMYNISTKSLGAAVNARIAF